APTSGLTGARAVAGTLVPSDEAPSPFPERRAPDHPQPSGDGSGVFPRGRAASLRRLRALQRDPQLDLVAEDVLRDAVVHAEVGALDREPRLEAGALAVELAFAGLAGDRGDRLGLAVQFEVAGHFEGVALGDHLGARERDRGVL